MKTLVSAALAAVLLASILAARGLAQTPSNIPSSPLGANQYLWSQYVPQSAAYQNDRVAWIKAGDTVWLDESAGLPGTSTANGLNMVRIDGQLVFHANVGTLELLTACILVTGQDTNGVPANFQVGTLTSRFPNLATIRLSNTNGTHALVPPGASSKYYTKSGVAGSALLAGETMCALDDHGFVVEDGAVLRLFGKDPNPVWTRLEEGYTIHDNDTAFTVVGNAPTGLVGWKNGYEIVVASTDFDQLQAEKKVLSGDATGVSVAVTTGFSNTHWGKTEEPAPLDSSFDIDERAEVAVLTRNVRVIGERLSAGTDAFRWYPHMMFLKGTNRGGGARTPSVRLCATEFTKLGREGVLSRYPLHFHELGDVGPAGVTKDWFIANCSVHETYNRGIVIHATQDLCIENNVVYNTVGNAYYFEDEAARNCLVRHNLGLVTTKSELDNVPDGCITQFIKDEEPSVFYFHSAVQRIVENVAAGARHAGFYFDLPVFELGNPSSAWSVGTEEEISFVDNVAHSCSGPPNGSAGFGVFQNTGNRRVDPANPAILVPQEFTNFRAYKCRWHGLWTRSRGEVLIQGCRIADCRSGMYPASIGDRVPGVGHFVISDCTLIGETANIGDNFSALENEEAHRTLPQTHEFMFNDSEEHELRWDILSGIEMYDGYIEVEKCRFANFEDRQIETIDPPIQLEIGDTFPPEWRQGGALVQVAKASAWANDPRNRVRKLGTSGLSFHNVVRQVILRNTDPRSSQVINSVIYDPEGLLDADGDGAPEGTAGYFVPKGVTDPPLSHPFLVDGITTAEWHSDAYGEEGINGYWVPGADVDYAQLFVKLTIDDPNTMPIKRIFDPQGASTSGVTYDCRRIWEKDNQAWFVTNLSTGAGTGSLAQHYYELGFRDTANPPQYYQPAKITLNYSFAEGVGEVLYLDFPIMPHPAISGLSLGITGNVTLDSSPTSRSDVLTSASNNAYYDDRNAGRVYMKLTSQNGLYGTQDPLVFGTDVFLTLEVQ
ncbi:MAG: hypothetical protein EYC70_01145 [Planctomycetota bacterium]|nr:MAG: hypothetical protein EYC70_01145 [Planctomycetota bacterium]